MHRTNRQTAGLVPVVMDHRPAGRGKSRPVAAHGGSGRLYALPLLGRLPLQLIEDQAAMLLEYAQRPFERMEHRLSNHRGVASI